MKAIKKPIEIEFYPCEIKYKDKIIAWSTKKRPIKIIDNDKYLELEITTLEGIYKANEKDVIIKGVNDEVYPCKKEIFAKTYQVKTKKTKIAKSYAIGWNKKDP